MSINESAFVLLDFFYVLVICHDSDQYITISPSVAKDDFE